ncbi:hypothetical protein [Peribacillus frigoritolerans]|uniref:hypothetical protein n=1 Tax=Peribacillus frigoritolerans TaxID=450367 RepID=UPI0022801452|nr:hypothetical protein [Peribacillus frigoritolerans]MCY9007229.1 hypothetical protein [Peribacillus frigoritolerans]
MTEEKYSTERLQEIFGEIADSIDEVENKSHERYKENSVGVMALASLLIDKKIITLDDLAGKKNEFIKKLDK